MSERRISNAAGSPTAIVLTARTSAPAGPTGDKTHISFNLRVDAAPAFVATPDGKAIASAVSYIPNGVQPVGLRDERIPFNIVDGLVVAAGERPVSQPESALSPPIQSNAGTQ